MESINWKKAKRDLAIVDYEAEKPAPTPEIFVRRGKADRTVYFREYWRARARLQVPEDMKCRFCKGYYAERKDWREFDEEMICKYCYSEAQRDFCGVRFLVDKTQIVQFIGIFPFLTDAAIARKCKVSTTLLYRIFHSQETWVTRKTYARFKRGWEGFVFTRNMSTVAPPILKRLRDAAGWTQKQAAEYLGLTREEYMAIENGRKSLKPGYLDMLMEDLKNGSRVV